MRGNDYLSVGKILGPWGRNGEIKLYPYTDHLERFEYLNRAYIADKHDRREVHVENARCQKKLIIVKIREIGTISEAETVRGMDLEVRREDAVKLPPDTYFICDILCCDVKTVDGAYVGTLKDVLKPGAHDVYVVATPDGKDVLIPAVKEFVKKVDLDARLILIKPIEGMLTNEN